MSYYGANAADQERVILGVRICAADHPVQYQGIDKSLSNRCAHAFRSAICIAATVIFWL